MPVSTAPALSRFAHDVADGLSARGQKYLSARYFYDELGSTLFEAITLLPEYGLTRADERLLQKHALEIANLSIPISGVCELGSGSGKKTRYILEALLEANGVPTVYSPIDVSPTALAACEREVGDLAEVRPVCADWVEGIRTVSQDHPEGQVLALFLGSSIGNLERSCIPAFLSGIHSSLKPGDLFLLGTDLVKDIDTMLTAYNDPTGVTAAFNLNLLGRINRELNADFDLRSFVHQVRWNAESRRIEMHLLSTRNQTVFIRALDVQVFFSAGETIWTESSHKFSSHELMDLAQSANYTPLASWVDREWPFAESLWRVDK
jgi:L-histidine N-alpha-methyltransferase